MRLSDSKYGVLLSTPGLVIILALILFPVLTLFVTSFLRYTSFHPLSFTGFKNYIYIFNDRIFWLALKKTVVYTIGVTVLTFAGGMALALAKAEHPDLVVLDLRLPDTDGFTVCNDLADDPATAGTPVIIVSGMVRPDIIRQSRAAGCSYYVRKPYDPNALLILIEQAIRESEVW